MNSSISLFRRYIIGEPTLKPCYLTSTIVSRQVTDIILTTKSSAISRLVIGQKRSNSGGVVAAATWYRSLAMVKKKRHFVEALVAENRGLVRKNPILIPTP